MRTVAVVAGLSVAAAYLLGSVPVGYLLFRRRLRRDLGRADLGAMGPGRTGVPRLEDVLASVLDTAKVLLAATLAWHLVEGVSPGSGRGVVPELSAVGFLADQVLTAWQSIALWAGAAAVVGHLAPPWLGFRRAPGEAPALGLAFVYCPAGFGAGVAVYFLVLAVARRPSAAAVAGLAAFVAWAWAAWVFDWPTGWGVTNGPELALWASVLTGILAARALTSPPPPVPGT